MSHVFALRSFIHESSLKQRLISGTVRHPVQHVSILSIPLISDLLTVLCRSHVYFRTPAMVSTVIARTKATGGELVWVTNLLISSERAELFVSCVLQLDKTLANVGRPLPYVRSEYNYSASVGFGGADPDNT